jgi:hypothetical protein
VDQLDQIPLPLSQERGKQVRIVLLDAVIADRLRRQLGLDARHRVDGRHRVLLHRSSPHTTQIPAGNSVNVMRFGGRALTLGK